MNREGAQVAVNAEVDYGSDENDVLGCHAVLRRLADDNALVKGGHLRNVTLLHRFNTSVQFGCGNGGYPAPKRPMSWILDSFTYIHIHTSTGTYENVLCTGNDCIFTESSSR